MRIKGTELTCIAIQSIVLHEFEGDRMKVCNSRTIVNVERKTGKKRYKCGCWVCQG